MTTRAKIPLTEADLHRLLGLPDDLTIRAVTCTQDPVAVLVHVTHSGLPDVPPGAESPFLTPNQLALAVASRTAADHG